MSADDPVAPAVARPGIYDLPADTYHADPCPEPSLSASIAHTLLTQSPRHAWHAHPRLGGGGGDDASPAMDLGTAVHALLLGKGEEVVVLDFADFRKDAAKEARDAARKAGKVPMLAKEWARAQAVAARVRQEVDLHAEAEVLFRAGKPERAMIWQEDVRKGSAPVWCRGMVDWLPDAEDWPIVDLKTTGQSAHPMEWERRYVEGGPAFQEAFYLRGARALGRKPRGFLFVVAETEPPFGVSVLSSSPELRAHAEGLVMKALAWWEHCTRTGEWPGYPRMTCYAGLPVWAQTKAEERVALMPPPSAPEPARGDARNPEDWLRAG